MVQQDPYVPGLYKIFDEIVVNAADNKQRDASMTEIKIDIDREKNKLSVYNNGRASRSRSTRRRRSTCRSSSSATC